MLQITYYIGNIYACSFHIPRWHLALLTHTGMNPDQILAITTWKVIKKSRYYFSLYVICVLGSKKVATALLLANLCSLHNLRHFTSVSQILALTLFHHLLYLCGLPDHVLDCVIHHRHGLYKLKFTDCYDFATCEIITKLEWLYTITLSL